MSRKIFYIFLLLAVAMLWLSCEHTSTEAENMDITCGAEKLTENGRDLYADNDSSIVFINAKFRTDIVSHTGKYSYITDSKHKYGLSFRIPDVRPDDHVIVSVWRKGSNNKAYLVAASETPHLFYKSKNKSKERINDWEKLQLDFYIPPYYTDNVLKVYVWNNSRDTVFFDDFSVRRITDVSFPDYQESALHIELDTSDYLKLLDVRARAFSVGILQTTDDDWVKGFIFAGDKMMKAKLRLKGDWLDHLAGPKWSFRIKLKKGNTWKRLKTFSLQSPVSRHGVDEWFLHQVFSSEGILMTRYGFTPVYLNNRNLGLYAWEEHFTKQLVESQRKREGPIVRFLENAHWDEIAGQKAGYKHMNLPDFKAAVIKPFSSSKIVRDSTLFKEFLIAQNLMLQYKLRKKTTSEIFNIDALARYFSLVDVFSAYHSLIWHNQRFYYNPVLCKLEPVAYDAYTEDGSYDWIAVRPFFGDFGFSMASYPREDYYLMLRELFNDDEFQNKYLKYLGEYSSAAYLQKITEAYGQKANYYDSLLQIEFPELKLDIPKLYENVGKIRKSLPAFKKLVLEREKLNKKWVNIPITGETYTTGVEGRYAKDLVVAYVMQQNKDSVLIRVKNFCPDPILVLGVGKSEKKIRDFTHPEPKLEGYLFNHAAVYEFWTSKKQANYIFFLVHDSETVTAPIYHWSEPDGSDSPLQQLETKNIFPDENLMNVTADKKVVFKKGNLVLDHPLIIPAAYKVYIKPGTEIDLRDSAMIISYAPVYLEGTASQPVVITSSDFTGNGIAVLQAATKSIVRYTSFKNLNTINYKGWTLTGAVTFYESDVDIDHALFYRNQCEDALNTVRSVFKVENVTFENIYGDAFDADFCQGEVNHCRYANIGNDAIDYSGSYVTISNTEISNVTDKGVSGGEESHLVIDNVTVSRSNIGLASKDLSSLKVKNTRIIDCNYGLVLLQKKPEYGPATMTLTHTVIKNARTGYLIEEGSEIVRDGKTIRGDKKNVAAIFYHK